MEHIGELIKKGETIILKGYDPVAAQGFTQVPNLILKSGVISAGAKLIYSLLLSYYWNNNKVFPGQGRLSKECGKSQGWVSQQAAELEKKGFLEIQRRGQGRTNIYILTYKVDKKN